MTRLYHGSNVAIEQIDLSRSKRGKDFGQGFYLNANADQAMAMAIRTARLLNEVQIRRYIMGYMSASALVEELRFRGDHAIQYFFGTPKALELLKHIDL